MKNLNRFLCFFLCFCLAFAWFGPPIEAQAVAVELGWVTYAIISYMAAMGFTFIVTGGANALENAIEGAFDEWAGSEKEGKIIYLKDYITFYEPPAGGPQSPNGNGFKIGVAAAVMLGEFIRWLRDHKGLIAGTSEEVDTVTGFKVNCGLPYLINGVETDLYLPQRYSSTGSITWPSYGQVPGSAHYDLIDFGTVLLPGDTLYSPSVDKSFTVNADATVTVSTLTESTVVDSSSRFEAFGYSPETDFYGYVLFRFLSGGVTPRGRICLAPLLNDGSVIFSGSTVGTQLPVVFQASDGNPISVIEESSGAVITSPETVTEISPNEGESVIIHTGSFASDVEGVADQVVENLENGDSPIVDYDIKTDYDLEFEPLPTPEIDSEADTDANVAGIVQWLKSIFDAILSLPQRIAYLMSNAIKSIFVPDVGYIDSAFQDFLDELNEKYSFDFDMTSLFSSEKEPEDISGSYNYQIGGVATYGLRSSNLLTFVAWDYLIDAVEFFRPFIRGWFILMLVFYNLKQFALLFNIDGLIGGMSQNDWGSYTTPRSIDIFAKEGKKKW